MNKEKLEKLINKDLSSWQIAQELSIGQSTVSYWLKKYGLKTNFNKFNTGGHRLDIRKRIEKEGIIYKCNYCGETDPDKFMKMGSEKKSLSRCKLCHSKKAIERFREYKAVAIAYKGGKCKMCGYNKCNGSLHFHHEDPKQKDPKWATLRNKCLEKVKKELDKCILVCANCHGELHWGHSV